MKEIDENSQVLHLHKNKWTRGNDVNQCILYLMKKLGQNQWVQMIVSHPQRLLCALQTIKTIRSWKIENLKIHQHFFLLKKDKAHLQVMTEGCVGHNRQWFMKIDLEYNLRP